MSIVDKAAVLAALRARVAADLDAISSSQQETQSGATHEESRPENDKDTRAVEATYLARGLAQRVHDLREAVTRLATLRLRSFDEDAPVGMTALVTVEDDAGEERRYFVAPAGGGLKLSIGDVEVAIVTVESPLGRALIGKYVDDDVQLNTPRGTRTLTIQALS